jgi:iron complex transport system ATP-binding protein
MDIAARSIGLTLGTNRILNAVDVELRAGEFVGLIGPNGAGKTSLLRILAGLRSADTGEVRYEGRELKEITSRERARAIAYLAQNDGVHWSIGVEALVELGRLPHRDKASDADDRTAVARALELVGLTDLRARSFDTLSGGEQARALLARALAVEAPILLADEPTAALDPYHQLQIMDLLQARAKAGGGVVAVLHDIGLAYRYCDRIVLLAQGRKIADGAPDEVLSDATIATAYGIAVKRGEGYILPWTRTETAR